MITVVAVLPTVTFAQADSSGHMPGAVASSLATAVQDEALHTKSYVLQGEASDISFHDGYADVVMHGLRDGVIADEKTRVSLVGATVIPSFSNPSALTLDRDEVLAFSAVYNLFNSDQTLTSDQVSMRRSGKYYAQFAEISPTAISIHFVFDGYVPTPNSLDGCPPSRSYLVNRVTLGVRLIHHITCP